MVQAEGVVIAGQLRNDQIFNIKGEAKKFDSAQDVIDAVGGSEEKFDELDRVEGIKLSGNSYGYEACKFIAEQF